MATKSELLASKEKLEKAIANNKVPEFKEKFEAKLDEINKQLSELEQAEKSVEKAEKAAQEKKTEKSEKQVEKAEEKLEKVENKAIEAVEQAEEKIEEAKKRGRKSAYKSAEEKREAVNQKRREAYLKAKEKKDAKAAPKKEAKAAPKKKKKIAPKKKRVTKSDAKLPKKERPKQKKAKRKSLVESITSFFNRNKTAKAKYKGVSTASKKRDAEKPAKRFGYRISGDGVYRKPTKEEIKKGFAIVNGRKRSVYWEGRPTKADVKRTSYPKLEHGGDLSEIIGDPNNPEWLPGGEMFQFGGNVGDVAGAGMFKKGGNIRSSKEIQKIYNQKKNIVDKLSDEEVVEMWNKNALASDKLKMSDFNDNLRGYLTSLLFEKELTENEYNVYFKKGGAISKKYNYLPNREIESVTTWDGVEIKGKDIIDGLYVRKSVKFASGGGIFGTSRRPKSAIMRDRKYKSNEPHELAYKRKKTPKNKRYRKEA
jgi:chemotaxis protein histidine kinase CheA